MLTKQNLGLFPGADSVHPVNVVLIEILDLFSFQFEGGCHQSGIWIPGSGDECDSSGNFELLKFKLQAVISQLAKGRSSQITILQK